MQIGLTLRIGLLFIMIGTLVPSIAQDIDFNNLKEINVDALTAEQIAKFAAEIEKRGLTEQQLELIAKSRGISSTQISKLKARLRNYSTSTDKATLNSIDRSRRDVLDNVQNNVDDVFDPLVTEEVSDDLQLFGLNYFNNLNLTFEPSLNIPTPQDYILGAGDQIIIDIWGASEQNYQLEISPEGSVTIPGLGPIYVSGLTIEECTRSLKSRLKGIYSGLGRNTFSQITLGKIRTIQVNILGEVNQPGTYAVSSFSTLLNGLYYAGGPSKNGSFRAIDLYRDSKLLTKVDLYEFFNGIEQNIPVLRDQDIIIVRPFLGRVLIDGEIKRPAYYEISPQDNFSSILELAGGFSDNALKSSVTIKRITEKKKTILTVNSDEFDNTKLHGGDEIYVSEVMNQFEDRVFVEGAINRPGEYELKDNMELLDLIETADGLRGDAYRNRAVIVRLKEDLTLKTISVDLNKILNGTETLELKDEDFIKIQSSFDLKESYTIQVRGEVNDPGQFPYIEDITIEDIVYLAGGFKESAATSFVEVARRIVSNDISNKTSQIFSFDIDRDLSMGEEDSKFVLEPFDLVVIRRSPNYFKQEIVEIEGEVYFPGKYSIEKKNERISDLLSRAGGLTGFGYVKGATLIRRTEYFVNPEEDAAAAKLRRENLRKISERDSLLSDVEFEIKQQESIGIELDKILQKPGSKYDLILKEGDVLSIPKQLETVRLRGELLYPSTVRYDKALNFRDYISRAGGFNGSAKKSKSYIVYANGSAERTKRFLWFNVYPNIEPGAEVIVPKKPDKAPLSAQAWVALASSATTLALAIQALIN